MPVQVSVIVPVLDTGPSTHDCVQSLLNQTMPRAQTEIILVRAGHTGEAAPTDPTSAADQAAPARSAAGSPAGSAADGASNATTSWLTALVRSHPHIRMVSLDQHQTRAGLRNAGVDEAHGTYVLVVDARQRLTPDAVRRMHALAQRNQADVVLGRLASPDRQTLPPGIRRARDHVPATDPLVWTSLRPFALYRRAFLNHHGIREPDEPSSQARAAPTVHALLAAKVISVAAEITHCHEPSLPAGDLEASGWALPNQYAARMREIVDLVDRLAGSPELRQVALSRVYRDEVLGRAQSGQEMFAQVSKLAAEQVFDPVHDDLPLVERLRSTLVRESRFAELAELTRRAERIAGRGHLTDAEWKNGQLRVSVTGSLVHAGPAATPIGLRRRDGRDFVDPTLLHGLVDAYDAEVTKELRRYRAEVVLRHRETGATWGAPANLELVVEHADTGADADGTPCTLSFRGIAMIDPERLAGRKPLDPGCWEIRLVLEAFGMRREVPLRAEHPDRATEQLRPAILGKPVQVVVPQLTHDGALLIDVDRRSTTLGSALRNRPVRPQPCNGRRLDLLLAAVSQPGTGTLDVELALRGADEHSSSVVLPARLSPLGSQVRLVASVDDAPGPVRSIRPGTWRLLARLDGARGPEIEVGSAHVDPRSRVYLVGADRIGPVADLSRQAIAAAVSRPGLRRLGVRVVDWLPESWQRRIRLAVRRARG